MISQGIDPELFHEDAYCTRSISWRYHRVAEWLSRHPEVTDFAILDDAPEDSGYGLEVAPRFEGHLLLTDFDEGVTVSDYYRLKNGKFPRKNG